MRRQQSKLQCAGGVFFKLYLNAFLIKYALAGQLKKQMSRSHLVAIRFTPQLSCINNQLNYPLYLYGRFTKITHGFSQEGGQQNLEGFYCYLKAFQIAAGRF